MCLLIDILKIYTLDFHVHLLPKNIFNNRYFKTLTKNSVYMGDFYF